MKFLRADALRPHDVPEVLAHVEARVMKLLKRRKLIAETPDGQPPPDEFARKNPAMAAIIQASLFDKSVLDPDRSVPPIRERGCLPDDVRPKSKNCTQHNQFTLHANTYIGAHPGQQRLPLAARVQDPRQGLDCGGESRGHRPPAP